MLDSRVIGRAEAALAALDLAAPRDVVAADLAKLAAHHREAIEIARTVEAHAAGLGRPGPHADLVAVLRSDATRIADGFALVAIAFDRARSAVLADAWPSRELVDVVRSHQDFADWLVAQLAALVVRAEETTARVRTYFDRAFARVHADPAWSAAVGDAFDADGKPRGLRLDDLPPDLDA